MDIRLWLVGILLASVAFGCYQPLPSPERLDEDLALATTYAYMFVNNCSNAQDRVDAYYLAYQNSNPPPYVFKLLEDCPIQIKRYSQCTTPNDRTQFINVYDTDNPKKTGLIFHIDSLTIYRDTASVIGGYYEGYNSFSREYFELERVDSNWSVKRQKMLLLQ